MSKFERINVKIFYLYNKDQDSYLGVDEDESLTWIPANDPDYGTMIHITKEVIDSIIETYSKGGVCYSDESVQDIDPDTEDEDDIFLSFTYDLGFFINDYISDIVFTPIEVFYRESGVSLRYDNLSVVTSSNNFTIYQKLLGEYFAATE